MASTRMRNSTNFILICKLFTFGCLNNACSDDLKMPSGFVNTTCKKTTPQSQRPCWHAINYALPYIVNRHWGEMVETDDDYGLAESCKVANCIHSALQQAKPRCGMMLWRGLLYFVYRAQGVFMSAWQQKSGSLSLWGNRSFSYVTGWGYQFLLVAE